MAKANELFQFSLSHSSTRYYLLHPPWNTPTFLASVTFPFPGFPPTLKCCFAGFPSWLLPPSKSLPEFTPPPQGWSPNPSLWASHIPWASEPCSQLPPTPFHLHTAISLPSKPVLRLTSPAPTCPTRKLGSCSIELSHLKPPSIQLPFSSQKTKSYSSVKNLQFRSDCIFPLKLQWFLCWPLILACLWLHYTPPFMHQQHCFPSLEMFPCSSKLASLVRFTLWPWPLGTAPSCSLHRMERVGGNTGVLLSISWASSLHWRRYHDTKWLPLALDWKPSWLL